MSKPRHCSSHDPWQIRAPRRALVAHIAGLLFGQSAVISAGESITLASRLGIASALLDQTRQRITTVAPALVAGNMQRVELANQVAEDDRAIAGH